MRSQVGRWDRVMGIWRVCAMLLISVIFIFMIYSQGLIFYNIHSILHISAAI